MHPPRYKIWFQATPQFADKTFVLSGEAYLLQVTQRLFYLRRKQNTSSAMSTEINEGERRRLPTHITLTRESYSRITPLPLTDGVHTSHILPRKPTLYPKFSCRSRPRRMPPGFQSYPFELLALIGRTDWGLRHFLREETI